MDDLINYWEDWYMKFGDNGSEYEIYREEQDGLMLVLGYWFDGME